MRHLVLVLLVACADDPPHHPPAPVPAPLPYLDPDAEAFWANFVGATPGTLGPHSRTWCQHALDDDMVELFGRHDFTLSRKRWRCAVLVREGLPVLRRELATIAARWQRLATPTGCASATWIVPDEQLTTQVIDGGEEIAIHWRTHRDIDELVGTDGILRDVDVEDFARSPDAPLRIRRPFHPCRDETSCLAAGPSGPGGFETTVFRGDPPTRVGVRIEAADTSAVLARLAPVLQRAAGRHQVRVDACSVTVLLGPP